VNYYERHLGDYTKDTAHLSMVEHGAYTLLLDRYYSTEQGIPADQAHRVARARSRDEKAAVDAVLAEFFTLKDGIWVNGRAEEEIQRATARINAAQANGKNGGRPKKMKTGTQAKPGGFPPGSENVTQQKALHTPDTIHQTIKEARTERGARDVDVDFDVGDAKPTPGGIICRALKAEGITSVNPGHPTLLALLDAGATEAEFLGLVGKARDKRDPFAYLLGALASQREEAALRAKGLHHGAMPEADDRKARQLETAALMTGGAAPPQRPPRPQPMDVVDVTSRLLG
jgi:uncharacterized protein YdaU (DUF1376 family)